MSNVINFRIRRRASSTVNADAGQARILLFTGIRYIRDEAPATPELPAPLPVAEDRLQA